MSPLRLRRVTSVDGDRDAGDEVRGGARKEYRDAGEIRGLAPAARGRTLEYAVVQAFHFHARLSREVGVHPAGENRVHLDVVGGPGRGERLRELHDSALARAIRGRKSRTEYGKHRTDVDDLAAARALQMRVRGAAAQERAVEIGGDDLLPLVERQ